MSSVAHDDRRTTKERGKYAIDDDADPLDSFTERRLIVPASDMRGRSERIWVRMQPLLIRACQMLVASKKFPWKTPGDFQRFAIADTIRRLLRDAPEKVQTVHAQMEAMKDILIHEEMHAEFAGIFERASRVIEMYRSTGARDEARRLISELRAQINAMPDGYWKGKHRKELSDRYRDLMDGAGESGGFIDLGGGGGSASGSGTGSSEGDEDRDRPPHDEDDESGLDERDLD